MTGKTDLLAPTQELALSIVVPTYNERDNVESLSLALSQAFEHIPTEVIFVDDSDDDTPEQIGAASRRLANPTFDIRLIHREPGPQRVGGLASAVQRGWQEARAEYVAVIDADLQHPPERLLLLYQRAIKHDADIVMATRYRPGGSYEGLGGIHRRLISVGLKWIAKFVFPDQLLRVSDPLGGFFLLRRTLLDGITLRPVGYKIALEVLIRCGWTRLVEIPYQFQARQSGTSKANVRQGLFVFQHIARLVREVPAAARLWKFCLVGGCGALLNLAVFAGVLRLSWPLWAAWLIATEVSLTGNFIGHSILTWRDLGRARWYIRFMSYQGTSAIGTLFNLLLFLLLTQLTHTPLLAQALAIVVSTFVNYWLAKRLTFVSRPVRTAAGIG